MGETVFLPHEQAGYALPTTSGSVNNNQTRLTSSGVTLVFTAPNTSSDTGSIAGIDIQADAAIILTASTSGTNAGILMSQDGRASHMATNLINGNCTSGLQGALCFPRSELQMNGTSGMNTC